MSEVFGNFMNSLFTTKSSELIYHFLSGHASIPNINAGMHLVLISSRTVFFGRKSSNFAKNSISRAMERTLRFGYKNFSARGVQKA